MPYYSCPECALTIQSVAGRFSAKTCPKCSVPLRGSDQIYRPDRRLATINRRFAAEPGAALSARRALECLLSEFDPAEFQVAALLTTELIANSIEHSGAGAAGSVHLEVTLTAGFLRVEVGDEGSGFQPACRAPDAPLDSHWGLHLVEQLADRWGVASEPPTLVWFELERSFSAHETERTTQTASSRRDSWRRRPVLGAMRSKALQSSCRAVSRDRLVNAVRPSVTESRCSSESSGNTGSDNTSRARPSAAGYSPVARPSSAGCRLRGSG